MGFGEEVVGIHAGGQHSRQRTSGLVRLDGGGQHHQIGVDVQLLVGNQVRGLHLQLIPLGGHLTDHTLHVLHAVLFHSATIELVKVLTGGTHVDVEDVHFGLGVLVTHQHSVLGGVHAADLGAVLLAFLGASGATRADALHEHDGLGRLAVGGTLQMTGGRTGGIGQTLELQRGDHVLGLVVGELVKLVHADGIETGSHNDGTVFLVDVLILLLVIDGTGGTHLGANTALAVLQHIAVVGIDGGDLRHSLSKRNVDGRTVVHTQVKLVGHLLHGALLNTSAATGTHVFLDEAGILLDGHVEVTHKALDLGHLAVGEDANLLVLSHVHHLGGQDTGGAVQRGERLIQLSHLTTDGGLLLNDVHLKTGVGNIQSGLDTGDTTADDQRTLGHGRLTGDQGGVQVDLSHRRLTQNNSLLGTAEHILMYPGALLADIRDFNHVGVDAGRRRSLAEGGLVHTGRARTHHDACQVMLLYSIDDHVLTGLRAHILIIGGKDHTGLVLQGIGNRLHVHSAGNVTAAPTYKNANSLHLSFPPYLLYFLNALTNSCCGTSSSRRAGTSSAFSRF